MEPQADLEFDQHAVILTIPPKKKSWWSSRRQSATTLHIPLGDIRAPITYASTRDVLRAAQHARSSRGKGGSMQGVLTNQEGARVFYYVCDGTSCLDITTYSGHPFSQLLVQFPDGPAMLQQLDAAIKTWSRTRRGTRSIDTTLETCVVCLAPIAPVAGQHWRCPHCAVALHTPCWKEWMLSSGDAVCPHCMQGAAPPPPPATPSIPPRARPRIAPPPSPSQPIYLEQQHVTPAAVRSLHPTTSAPPALHASAGHAWDAAEGTSIVPDRWASVGSAITDLPEASGRQSIDTRLVRCGVQWTQTARRQVHERLAQEEGSGTSEGPSSMAEDGLPLPMQAAWRSSSIDR